eukprot:scaffold2325_cov374-Prasinococcus_capsulatus_cf.AAC.12
MWEGWSRCDDGLRPPPARRAARVRRVQRGVAFLPRPGHSFARRWRACVGAAVPAPRRGVPGGDRRAERFGGTGCFERRWLLSRWTAPD